MAYAVLSITIILQSVPARAEGRLVLTDDGLTAGYATFSWSDFKPDAADISFEIKLYRSAQLLNTWQTPDRATSLTGLEDGDYRLVVSAPEGTAVEQQFTVNHHSLSRAFSFFGLGALVFAVLIWLLVSGRGHRNT